MAKKKSITQSKIIEFYMDYVLTHNEQPKSVYAFAKHNNFEEQNFYEFFGSFDALEQSIFKIFFDNAHAVLEKSEDYINFDARNKLLSFYYTFFEILTANRSYVVHALEQSIFKIFFDNAHAVLEKSEDYINFDARNKLLSFYYTFFEILTANRSYVVHALEHNKNQLKSLKTLAKLKQRFSNYIEHLNIKTLDLKQEQLERLQNRGLKETAWLQLLVTMKFWLDDTSPSFEKTDLFIEKSVRASFDLIDTTPLKSLIDLGKFLYKEKMHSN